MTIERTILSNLVFNDEFCRRVIPYVKVEYFSDQGEQNTFTLIDAYILKYNLLPTIQALTIDLQNEVETINEQSYAATIKVIEELTDEKVDAQGLLDSTEK